MYEQSQTLSIIPPELRDAKILFVGEAPGADEEKHRRPFIGASGELLMETLQSVGLTRTDAAYTNVYLERPPHNNLMAWGVSKKDHDGAGFSSPAIPAGKALYVEPSRTYAAITRLWNEIYQVKPNIVVALGNTALVALTGVGGITKARGALTFVRGQKILPTYHPAHILRQYSLKPVLEIDIIKMKKESLSPSTTFKERTLYLFPTIEDLAEIKARCLATSLLTIDVETKARQITCIGFAPSATEAFVVPFWSKSSTSYHYWSLDHEILAWKAVREICQSSVPKLAQNGLYDMQYLLVHGITPKNFLHDTMLLHHSLYPQLPKSLDFLGSVHVNERAWKRMRPRGRDRDELKQEE